MQRVVAYIDGFNLYFGLKSKGWRKYYWLDLVRLVESLLKPGQELAHCHYFTARIRTSGGNSADSERQSDYLDALATLPRLSIHEGHYLQKEQSCRQCGSRWFTHEEKMTDVNIAAQLLVDSYEDTFDTAMIISGDSDLTTPVQRVRERFADKRVIIALPPNRRSHKLSSAANGFFTIGEAKIRQSQLAPEITTPSGHVLRRPAHWRQGNN